MTDIHKQKPIYRQIVINCALICSLCYSLTSPTFGSELYFLCGPDEDGCFEEAYRSCACVPQDNEISSPHCLDFNTMRCTPLSQVPNCPAHLIYKNQGDCIATIFHSTPTTPCHIKTREFCVDHHIQFCAKLDLYFQTQLKALQDERGNFDVSWIKQVLSRR